MKREYYGTVLSLIGMVLNILAFHSRKKRTLLLLHTAATGFHMCSYVFSGGGMGIYLNAVFLVRSLSFLKAENKSRAERKNLYFVICVSCVGAYVLFLTLHRPAAADALWSLIPVIGAFFGTYAFVQTDMIALRRIKMVDSVSWLLYNGHVGVGALGGFLGEVFNIAGMLHAIYRDKREGNGE
ncbi:MAG: YgjV family protein [Clostridiales bacterium]|nr:YgjV family protein [Clostridiales bacterium]